MTAAALLLRLYGLSRHVVDLDELFQIHLACKAASLGEFLPLLRDVPLHAVFDPLLTFTLAQVSTQLWWLRLQPVILGTACVPVMFALARRFGDATALLSCGLLAISVVHIEFSGFVDFYPALVLWTLTSTGLLLAAEERGGRAFAAYAAAMAGFLYTHPWAVLVMALHGIWIAVWRRERLAAFLLASLAAGLAFLPWFLYATSRLLAETGFRYQLPHSPLPLELLRTWLTWTGHPERRVMYDLAPLAPWALPAAPAYAALFGLGVWRLRREGSWNARWALAALLAFGGVAAVLCADRLFSYAYMPRQALFALPFFLLFAAEGLRWVAESAARKMPSAGRLARAAPGLALVLLSLGTVRQFSRQLRTLQERFAGNDLRIGELAEPGRPLIFDEPNYAALVLFYYDRAAFGRMDPPRLRESFYVFGVPEGLTAGGHPVAVVWDPDSTPAQESRRWAALARQIESLKSPGVHIQFGLMRLKPKEKAAEFMAKHPAAFARRSRG